MSSLELGFNSRLVGTYFSTLRFTVYGLNERAKEKEIIVITLKTPFQVYVGVNFDETLGKVALKQSSDLMTTVWPVVGLFLVFIPIAIFVLWYKKRRDRKQIEEQRERERFMEEEHIAAANASRNGEF